MDCGLAYGLKGKQLLFLSVFYVSAYKAGGNGSRFVVEGMFVSSEAKRNIKDYNS